jgi:hypothetical protein
MSELKDNIGNTVQIPDGPANTTYTFSNPLTTTEATSYWKAQSAKADVELEKMLGDAVDVEQTLPDAMESIRRESEHIVSTSIVMNGIVTPNLRVLLADVLGALDASIPNRDQNKAVKHIVRTAFDRTYYDILRRAYPDTSFGHDGGYAVEPEPDRAKVFSGSTLK